MDSTGSTNNRSRNATRRKRRKPMQDQRFSNYLTFGFEFTVCLGVFALTYAVVLVALWPLLSAKGPEHVPKRRPIDFLKKPHIPPSLKDIHLPGKEKISDMALSMKKKLQKINTEEELFEQAKLEFEILKKEKESKRKKLLRKAGDKKTLPEGQRSGFMVLGMHRSGTSMLSGLLHTSCGYTVGGPLIGSAADNEKGFFERIDIVLQNDEFMWKQGVWWATNVINYDWKKALTGLEDGTVDFKVHGESGLAFLNNPDNAPWLQKDPRMCITLKTWLKLMNNEPAIVFTYRHPLEVAMSLKRREKNFTISHGLRLWIVYNMRAIQNSKGLCIVRSSNDAILADPLHEVQRISDDLTTKCNVVQPQFKLTQEDVDKFIDPALQHNKKERAAEEKEVIAEYNDGKCKVYGFESQEEEGGEEWKREHKLYGMAMKIYCDFQSGKAYEDDYEWPELS